MICEGECVIVHEHSRMPIMLSKYYFGIISTQLANESILRNDRSPARVRKAFILLAIPSKAATSQSTHQVHITTKNYRDLVSTPLVLVAKLLRRVPEIREIQPLKFATAKTISSFLQCLQADEVALPSVTEQDSTRLPKSKLNTYTIAFIQRACFKKQQAHVRVCLASVREREKDRNGEIDHTGS